MTAKQKSLKVNRCERTCMAYKYKIFEAFNLYLCGHCTHVYSFQSFWHKYRKQNVSAKQGIHKCSLMIKNKYGCQMHRIYAYDYWTQSLLAYLLINLWFSLEHICITHLSVLSWSLLLLSCPAAKMSCAIPKTLTSSLKIVSIFGWSMSFTGATPNGSLVSVPANVTWKCC